MRADVLTISQLAKGHIVSSPAIRPHRTKSGGYSCEIMLDKLRSFQFDRYGIQICDTNPIYFLHIPIEELTQHSSKRCELTGAEIANLKALGHSFTKISKNPLAGGISAQRVSQILKDYKANK